MHRRTWLGPPPAPLSLHPVFPPRNVIAYAKPCTLFFPTRPVHGISPPRPFPEAQALSTDGGLWASWALVLEQRGPLYVWGF